MGIIFNSITLVFADKDTKVSQFTGTQLIWPYISRLFVHHSVVMTMRWVPTPLMNAVVLCWTTSCWRAPWSWTLCVCGYHVADTLCHSSTCSATWKYNCSDILRNAFTLHIPYEIGWCVVRAPDEMHKMYFNRHYLFYFLTNETILTSGQT